MKASKIILGLFVAFVLTVSATSAQQQFTQTVNAKNMGCNGTCSVIDIPELNNNPTALLFITPVLVNGVNPNPHPIGAYYLYLNKWSVYNLDGVAIPAGAKFNVEYYPSPDANHFVYVVPKRVRPNDPDYIDYAGLNNNPSAQIRFSPTNPPSRSALYNRDDLKIEYDATALKWYIANVNGKQVTSGTAYNIVFSNFPIITSPTSKDINTPRQTPAPTIPVITYPTSRDVNTPRQNPVSTSSTCNCVIPTTLPPNGNAGGDLSGSYPNPTVQKLLGKPLSNDPPAVGQVLKWNGSAWEPANENAAGGTTYNAGTGLAIQGNTIYANNIAPMWNANKISGQSVSNTTPTVGQILKWNGAAWEPATDNVATAGTAPQSITTLQTFLKNGSMTTSQLSGNYFQMTDLTHQIVITKRSRFVIAATIDISNTDSAIGFNSNKIRFEVFVNGVSKMFVVSSLEAGAFNTSMVGPFMIDEEAGTYNVEFKVMKVSGILSSANTFAKSNQSSIIVISSDSTGRVF